jgi:3,4-dihydroxy 2-butanone 4-phosphate synthase/GTP cyclohydrolase II
MVVVLDGPERENEGDLVMAAEHATPAAVNFMAQHGRGLVCVALPPERLRELGIPPMVEENTAVHGTAFGVSVDLRLPGHTGISAHDRAATIQALVNPASRPEELARPGHVFPLRAAPGGVLERPGHTEAAIDLMRLAGLQPAGVLCEVLAPDGTMARRAELERFATRHGLRIVTVADLVAHLGRRLPAVRRVGEARLPTVRGLLRAVGFEQPGGPRCVALLEGEPEGGREVLTRVHSECLTGDVFGSTRCDCREQLEASLDLIHEEGTGVVLYILGHEGRGIGLMEKLRAYGLQDGGRDTVEANHELGYEADLRDFGIAAAVLESLGIRSVRLLTNNGRKAADLASRGIEIAARLPLEIAPRPENIRYLRTTRDKLGHVLDGLDRALESAR